MLSVRLGCGAVMDLQRFDYRPAGINIYIAISLAWVVVQSRAHGRAYTMGATTLVHQSLLCLSMHRRQRSRAGLQIPAGSTHQRLPERLPARIASRLSEPAQSAQTSISWFDIMIVSPLPKSCPAHSARSAKITPSGTATRRAHSQAAGMCFPSPPSLIAAQTPR